ncbi:uncharacterized protein LOC126890211 [Diabrotica virgifera virgifera]|uniref:Uncharacterized protein n=1 Tax=Diabrotica virgifera virgifera TaxID=50390 RepID=A0ABM5KXW9_DIAVI|nr:uncharacterized protein LOC126890211 [Diabrotica virgifera virgifera]
MKKCEEGRRWKIIIYQLNRLTKGCVGMLSLTVSLVCALIVNQFIHMTESITTNIVCSKWYTADISVKKDVLFILLSTQRPFTLNALPLGTLNLELLLLVRMNMLSS